VKTEWREVTEGGKAVVKVGKVILWFAKTLADFEINEIAAALPAPVLL